MCRPDLRKYQWALDFEGCMQQIYFTLRYKSNIGGDLFGWMI